MRTLTRWNYQSLLYWNRRCGISQGGVDVSLCLSYVVERTMLLIVSPSKQELQWPVMRSSSLLDRQLWRPYKLNLGAIKSCVPSGMVLKAETLALCQIRSVRRNIRGAGAREGSQHEVVVERAYLFRMSVSLYQFPDAALPLCSSRTPTVPMVSLSRRLKFPER